MQFTERDRSMAVLLAIDRLFIYYFFNRENFEKAAPNIQICVELLYNIIIGKC